MLDSFNQVIESVYPAYTRVLWVVLKVCEKVTLCVNELFSALNEQVLLSSAAGFRSA